MTENSSENQPLSERENRLSKLQRLSEAGVRPYPERFEKKLTTAEALLLPVGTEVQTAGRMVRFREMGKIAFAHLQDFSGRMQIIFKKDLLGEELYKRVVKLIDLGDFLGVYGEIFVTKTGEISILVKEWTFLGKALLPLPEKFHGVSDKETLYRQRYLDLISSDETRARFRFRSAFVRALREFYWQEGFEEVETPTLLHSATGAAARPYHTHNNALDIDVVLRISHELPLKELIVGGYEKIFEIGKAFRNEGQDASHLPEHTHIEHYAAYWNFEDNIKFTERMFDFIFRKVGLPSKLKVLGRDEQLHEVDFATPWPRVDFVEMVCRDSGLDIMSYTDADHLRADLSKKGITFEGMEQMGITTLVDNIYKKLSRPKIINPTILYHYPKFLQPLARVNDADARYVDQFQLVVNGWEMAKAYSELVDPLDQRARFAEQAQARDTGDEEAMESDDDYLTAMEHGMPPISGWGAGVDRIVAILTAQDNLRDVVLFPLLRPSKGQAEAS